MKMNEILALAAEYEHKLPEAKSTEYQLDATFAKFIDHTILKPEATPAQIDTLCADARTYGFASVCINPIYVPQAFELLEGSEVDVCTVIGFPLGADSGKVKAMEAKSAIAEGAIEIDMVQSVGMLKGEAYQTVLDDVRGVADVCHANGAILKVIFENCLLTEKEKILSCLISKAAGADYVKTSTGFNKGGATVEDVRLMRAVVGPELGVKAAGGVRTLADAKAMLAVGATRMGASAGVKIMKEILG